MDAEFCNAAQNDAQVCRLFDDHRRLQQSWHSLSDKETMPERHPYAIQAAVQWQLPNVLQAATPHYHKQ